MTKKNDVNDKVMKFGFQPIQKRGYQPTQSNDGKKSMPVKTQTDGNISQNK